MEQAAISGTSGVAAGVFFSGLGYRQVFDRLCAGLAGLPVVRPSGSALRQARQRLGPAPMKALFDLVRGPAATTAAAGRWRGLRVVAVDGTLLPVPDCPANLAVFTRQRLGNGTSGYPQLRLAALVACGTRSAIGAVIGPATSGELEYARRLAVDLRAGMLLLGDRNLSSAALLNHWAATGADLLVRCKANRNLPPVARCGDGSTLARIGALTIRVIDAEISIRTAQGTRTGHYRLLTTLTDPTTHPAGELVRLYHERWEIETAYAELKSTVLGGRVLRARPPDGIEQEVWSLLTVYQALRIAMTDATGSVPGTDPDRPRPARPGRGPTRMRPPPATGPEHHQTLCPSRPSRANAPRPKVPIQPRRSLSRAPAQTPGRGPRRPRPASLRRDRGPRVHRLPQPPAQVHQPRPGGRRPTAATSLRAGWPECS